MTFKPKKTVARNANFFVITSGFYRPEYPPNDSKTEVTFFMLKNSDENAKHKNTLIPSMVHINTEGGKYTESMVNK